MDKSLGTNRPYSYFRYRTGTSTQWRLMWGNISRLPGIRIHLWRFFTRAKQTVTREFIKPFSAPTPSPTLLGTCTRYFSRVSTLYWGWGGGGWRIVVLPRSLFRPTMTRESTPANANNCLYKKSHQEVRYFEPNRSRIGSFHSYHRNITIILS